MPSNFDCSDHEHRVVVGGAALVQVDEGSRVSCYAAASTDLSEAGKEFRLYSDAQMIGPVTADSPDEVPINGGDLAEDLSTIVQFQTVVSCHRTVTVVGSNP